MNKYLVTFERRDTREKVVRVCVKAPDAFNAITQAWFKLEFMHNELPLTGNMLVEEVEK